MKFVAKVLLFPVVLLSAFLVLMLKWTLNREWLQFLILLVAEFGCFVLIFMGALIVEAAERFNGWIAGL